MCGIFAYLGKLLTLDQLRRYALLLEARGPDDFEIEKVMEGVTDQWDLVYAFSRLAIMDVSAAGNQPMRTPDGRFVLICNGEIYNHEILKEKYDFHCASGSDCEVILYMVSAFGIERTLKELDGVFCFVIVDSETGKIWAARDPVGVRPGFIGKTETGEYFIASEIKAIAPLCDEILHLEPGHYLDLSHPTEFIPYFGKEFALDASLEFVNEEVILNSVRDLLQQAVDKRIMADRPIGCLLSGGLDSSLITALVNQHYEEGTLNTFSVGLKGSTDLFYAQKVANFCKTNHHHIELTIDEFLDAIDEVIYAIESYDTTTVRASVGNYLVSKYIRQNSGCKVIFNGDGSEEIFGSYVYFQNAPSETEFYEENKKLITEIHFFDVLRSDRSISSNGLEARTPFLDKQLVSYVMSLPVKWKTHGPEKIEKYILRKAFESKNLLPEEVLWRKKEAFSDGVSSKEKSWFQIIQEYVDTHISDLEFEEAKKSYTHLPPQLKETLYYRRIFEKYFGTKAEKLVPHYWLPNWSGDVSDPSARVLNVYQC